MWSYIKAKLFTGIGFPSILIPFGNLALADIREFENRQLLSFAYDNIDEFRVPQTQVFFAICFILFFGSTFTSNISKRAEWSEHSALAVFGNMPA